MKYMKIFIFFLICASPLFFAAKFKEYRLFNEGKKYFVEKDYEKAAEIFGSLSGEKSKYNENISLYMAGKESTEGKEVEEIVNRANKLYREKKYEDAKEEYWKALLLSKDESIIRNYERSLIMAGKEKKDKKEDENKEKNKNKNKDENKMQNEENTKKNKSEQKNSENSNENNNGKDSKSKNDRDNKDMNKENEKASNEADSLKNEKTDNQSEENAGDRSSQSEEEKGENKENTIAPSKENTDDSKNKEKEGASLGDKGKEKSEGQDVEELVANQTELEKGEIENYLEMLSNLEKDDLKNNYRPLRKGGNNEKTKNW